MSLKIKRFYNNLGGSGSKIAAARGATLANRMAVESYWTAVSIDRPSEFAVGQSKANQEIDSRCSVLR